VTGTRTVLKLTKVWTTVGPGTVSIDDTVWVKESTCVDVLVTKIVVGTILVMVVGSPETVVVIVVETYDVLTEVTGIRTVLKLTKVWVIVGPGTVVGTRER
jgi:hypothetical protein